MLFGSDVAIARKAIDIGRRAQKIVAIARVGGFVLRLSGAPTWPPSAGLTSPFVRCWKACSIRRSGWWAMEPAQDP